MSPSRDQIIDRLLHEQRITPQEAEVLRQSAPRQNLDQVYPKAPQQDPTANCTCRVENGGDGICHCVLGQRFIWC